MYFYFCNKIQRNNDFYFEYISVQIKSIIKLIRYFKIINVRFYTI